MKAFLADPRLQRITSQPFVTAIGELEDHHRSLSAKLRVARRRPSHSFEGVFADAA